MKWLFSSGGYIKVYDDTKEAWFNVDDLKIKIAWTTSNFTVDEWQQILTCVKQAKYILKKIKRL